MYPQKPKRSRANKSFTLTSIKKENSNLIKNQKNGAEK